MIPLLIRQAAFEGKGSMLKGNLHCHTTRSDGAGKPDAVIRQFAAANFDFLALTDHRFYNYENYAPETDVLIIPGMEMDANLPGPGVHCVHVVSVGPEKENGFAQNQRFESLKISTAGEAQPMIDQMHQANNLPIFCHPQWSGTGVQEIEELKDFSLMEIWNSGCSMENDMDTNAACWDELLCHGRKIYGVATDDGHSVQQHGLGYVRVRAEKNVASILEALKNGAFYASCGPEIYDFFVEDGVATVVCSPVETINFRHFRVPYATVRGHGHAITSAQAQVWGRKQVWEGTGYIRAEVTDAMGRKAWTNPIFLDELWKEKK